LTLTNAYSTVAQFTARYLPGQTVAATSDLYTELEEIIESTSRLIDEYTGRYFYTATADATRYYTATNTQRVYIDDYQTITTLKTDTDNDGTYDTTLSATTDYRLCPVQPVNGWPYQYIEIRPHADNNLSCGPYAVEVVGLFGWSSVPKPIQDACLLQSFRIYKRQAAPFGVVGSGELGTVSAIPAGRFTGLDPDVETMLKPFMRLF